MWVVAQIIGVNLRKEVVVHSEEIMVIILLKYQRVNKIYLNI